MEKSEKVLFEIIKDAGTFLGKGISRGDAISLDDICYELSEMTFSDIEHLEDICWEYLRYFQI